MNDQEVKARLYALLKGLVAADQIDLLFDDFNGRRLALCLCIDLVSSRIDVNIVANILNSVTNTRSSSRQFAALLNAHPLCDSLRCAIREVQFEPEQYVRIVSIGSFINFYLRQYGFNSQDPADIAEVKRRYFSKSLYGQPLGDVKRCWSGQFGLVWVLQYSKFVELWTANRNHLAQILNDRLGLGYTNRVGFLIELGAVRYPSDFSYPAMQPTTFDADWELDLGFYLSIKYTDNWGKTCSCTGLTEGCKERVHKELQSGLTDEFRGIYVGEIQNLAPDLDVLLNEGFERFRDI